MKTIKHEIKLEKSVKIILGAFVFGIILNAFVTPTGQELFGIKKANASHSAGGIDAGYGSMHVTIDNWPNK